MALITTIRKNSWLLIVSLGLALGAFIIMDITGSRNMGGGSQFELGTVDGQEIDYRDFQRTEQVLYSGSSDDMYNRRDYLWNYFVEKHLVEKESKALGISVGKDELLELQFGNNLSPVVIQRFMDPQTGGIDRAQLNNIKQGIESGQLPENIRPFWAYQEKEIIKFRLQDKLTNLVTKGMYVPTWYLNQENNWSSQTASMAVVKVPFSEVADTDIEVSDSDIKKYMDSHKDTYYKDEETRVGQFVTLRVSPTSRDSANLIQLMEEKKVDFAEVENDSIFSITNDGFFVSIYATRDDLPAEMPDGIFETEPGSVYGPYVNGNYYEIAKVVDEMIVADSVKARHIIRQASAQQFDAVRDATALLDSLKGELLAGRANFDSLSVQYGQDASRDSGGDLGTFSRNMMIPEFSYHVFYQMDEGEYKVFQSSMGVHLVQVQKKIYNDNKKGVKLGIARTAIVPSEDTQNEMYDYAIELITEAGSLSNMDATIESNPMLMLTTTAPLSRNDYKVNIINDNDTGRSVVQWLFEKGTKKNDLSDVFVKSHPELYYNEFLYIVGLKEILPKGMPPVDAVRNQISPILAKDKKGEVLRDRLGSMDMNAIASQYSTDVDTLRDVKLSSDNVLGLGREPLVVASAFQLSDGQTSKPVIGNNGVYVVKVLNKQSVPVSGDIANSRKRVNQQLNSGTAQGVIESMKSKAKVKDYRSNFF